MLHGLQAGRSVALEDRTSANPHPGSPACRLSVEKPSPSRPHLSFFLKFFKKLFTYFNCLYLFIAFLGPHPHPRLGIESELPLLGYTTATATWDPSRVCDLHRSSWQCRILNPRREARDGTRVLTDTSRIRFCCATTGTPSLSFKG